MLGVFSHEVPRPPSPLEKKLTLLKKTPPTPLKNEVSFQEILTRKRIQILHFINISVSLVKQHGKKLAVILLKHQFSLGVYKILKNTRTVAKYCST